MHHETLISMLQIFNCSYNSSFVHSFTCPSLWEAVHCDRNKKKINLKEKKEKKIQRNQLTHLCAFNTSKK